MGLEAQNSYTAVSILVSRSLAHALDPMLPEDQMTQCETPTLPNRCDLIIIKIAFPSGLVRSYLDFLLSFVYSVRVFIPFKVQ